MKSILGKSLAIGIGLASAFALTPASAAPFVHLAPGSTETTSNIIHVQQSPGSPRSGLDFYRGGSHDRHHGGRHYRGGHHSRGHHSYRGHRYYRGGHYYRHDNGAGLAAGLITGAIVGGVIANGVSRGGGGSSHVQWCYNHYRSYRASDNTYQPYNGPRRQCNSPY